MLPILIAQKSVEANSILDTVVQGTQDLNKKNSQKALQNLITNIVNNRAQKHSQLDWLNTSYIVMFQQSIGNYQILKRRHDGIFKMTTIYQYSCKVILLRWIIVQCALIWNINICLVYLVVSGNASENGRQQQKTKKWIKQRTRVLKNKDTVYIMNCLKASFEEKMRPNFFRSND